MIARLRRRGGIRPQELAAVAKIAGWEYARSKGSHVTYRKAGFPLVLTIPQHPADLRRGLALKLLNIVADSLEKESEEDG